jgi:hypothetical protein
METHVVRKRAHVLLVEEGVDRVDEGKFRLVRPPHLSTDHDHGTAVDTSAPGVEVLLVDDPEDEGVPVDEFQPIECPMTPADLSSVTPSGGSGLR